jgi:hypothetical protein
MAFNFNQYTANNPLLQPINEDGDNVTAADNAAYGADQEIGEPLEENEIDIALEFEDEFDSIKDKLASMFAYASENKMKDWMMALNKIRLRLEVLEGEVGKAATELGILPIKEDGPDYTSSEEFDYMTDDELDQTGFTGDDDLSK